jgi:hypothetical protein
MMQRNHEPLWTSKNGKWTIGPSYPSMSKTPSSRSVWVQDERAAFADHPIRTPQGTIAYNWPERVPEYVKKEVAKII